MTNLELQQQIKDLQNQLNALKDVYYSTHFIDKDVFNNPVYLPDKVIFPNKTVYQREVTTTTATTTLLHSSTLGLYGNGIMQVNAIINGISPIPPTTPTKFGSYTLKAVVKFVFGVATVIAQTITPEFETDASWNVTITTSGTSYLINVVSSADSILWTGVVEEYI